MRYDTECSISAAVEVIRSEIDEIRGAGLYSTADSIEGALSDITSAVDTDVEDDDDEFTTLIPSNISAGDADELKDLILNWRKEHGYGIPS